MIVYLYMYFFCFNQSVQTGTRYLLIDWLIRAVPVQVNYFYLMYYGRFNLFIPLSSPCLCEIMSHEFDLVPVAHTCVHVQCKIDDLFKLIFAIFAARVWS
jgi:hypothetical protein